MLPSGGAVVGSMLWITRRQTLRQPRHPSHSRARLRSFKKQALRVGPSSVFCFPMLPIREIDHVVLRVVDLQAMLRFYCDALGCSIERRQDELGLVQLRAGRSLVDLVPVDGKLGREGGAPPGREGRNMDHFCFRVEPFDADAIRRELNRHGITAGEVASRYGAEGHGPSMYVKDPEGNVVELKGPPETTAAKSERCQREGGVNEA